MLLCLPLRKIKLTGGFGQPVSLAKFVSASFLQCRHKLMELLGDVGTTLVQWWLVGEQQQLN